MKTSEKKYAYDVQYAKEKLQQVKLSLNREHDADILLWLDKQPNKQGYIKELIRTNMNENDKMISVALSNKDCIFDSGLFTTLSAAVEFSRNRGGKYVVQIGYYGQLGKSYSYDSDSDAFSWYDGYEWIPVTADQLL